MSEESSNNGNEVTLPFPKFAMTRVLNEYQNNCSIVVEGKFEGESDTAVVILQKLPFKEEKIEEVIKSVSSPELLFKNDVYHNHQTALHSNFNDIKVNTIYPASEKHILKYERQPCSVIVETPEIYKSVTLSYIENLSNSIQWVYNILEHKSEVDRIVIEDEDEEVGFTLIPDMKWNGEDVENLYLQAIVRRRDLRSIRDLRGEHLPLLRNIYKKSVEAIEKKYGVCSNRLRIYVHYLPSYFHFHVHFTVLSFEGPGTWAGKAHLVTDIISHLEIDSSFYTKVDLSFVLKDNSPYAVHFASCANGGS